MTRFLLPSLALILCCPAWSLSTTSELRAAWAPACQPASMGVLNLQLGDARLTVDKRTFWAFNELHRIMAAHGYAPPRGSTGAYNCRQITGGTGYSLHSYGIAADYDWNNNPYQSTLKTNMPLAMVDEIKRIRTKGGHRVFRWGGDYTGNKDAMHYEIVASPAELALGLGSPGVDSATWKDTGKTAAVSHSGAYGTGSVTFGKSKGGATTPAPDGGTGVGSSPNSCVATTGEIGTCIKESICVQGTTRSVQAGRCMKDPADVKCCYVKGNPCTSSSGTKGACINESMCKARGLTVEAKRCPNDPVDVKCCFSPAAAAFEVGSEVGAAAVDNLELPDSVPPEDDTGGNQDITVEYDENGNEITSLTSAGSLVSRAAVPALLALCLLML